MAQLTSTNLPIINISTSGIPIGDTQIMATMNIINNAGGGTNSVNDVPVFSGNIGLNIRGSLTNAKPSYDIETWSSFDQNINVSLLGMAEENDWVLLSMYTDRSLMRNIIANQIFSSMGYWSPQYRLCEVLINGAYKGVYLFGETIKRDIGRLDIANLKITDNWYPEITGGYILKLDEGNSDGYTSAFAPPNTNDGQEIIFRYVEPKKNDITTVQKDWVKSYTDSFENALNGNSFQDTTIGWRAFASEKSVMNFMILNEVIGNEEAYRKNMYLWKDKEKKIRFGPLWKADNILNNTADCSADNTSAWMYEHSTQCPTDEWQPAFWWQKFLSDSLLSKDLKCRYTSLRVQGGTLDTTVIFAKIDSIALLLNANSAQQRNFILYPIFGQVINNEPLPLSTNYAEEIIKIKQFIANRLAFLDIQWLSNNCEILNNNDVIFNQNTFSLSPNPTTNFVNVTCNAIPSQKIAISINNICGQVVYERHDLFITEGKAHRIDSSTWPSGVYVIKIKSNNGKYWIEKIVKE